MLSVARLTKKDQREIRHSPVSRKHTAPGRYSGAVVFLDRSDDGTSISPLPQAQLCYSTITATANMYKDSVLHNVANH